MPAKHGTEDIDTSYRESLLHQFKCSRIVNPTNWSLRLRFLIVPALLLGLGYVTLGATFLRYQDIDAIESIESRLSLFRGWIQDKIANEFAVLLLEVSPLAAMPETIQGVRNRDKDKLVRFILPYVERLRSTTGRDSLYFHFHLPPATSFLRTWDVDSTGADLSDTRPMVVKANKYDSPFKGIEVGPGGADMRVIFPVSDRGEHLGTVEAATSLENILQTLPLPSHFGALLLIDKRFENTLSPNKIRAIHGNWIVGRSLGIEQEKQLFEALDRGETPKQLGRFFYQLLPLEDFEGKAIGGILVAYDSTQQLKSIFSESVIFTLFFLGGSTFLWFHIYLNVARVKQFLTRLDRVLANTISGNFSRRFETEPVHCRDILQCNKQECPVFNNPLRICYQETGSEAFSTQDRNTCCFLSKYKNCRFCPVYSMRRGDELVEMRNTVNTLMHLWGRFAGRVDQTISGVLQTPEASDGVPSLNQISISLEYMAGLTAFSHDLQGVYNKPEVYNILSNAFVRSFGLDEFAILEVDAVNHAVSIASNTIRQPNVLCTEMFCNPELCRTNRLGKSVCSSPNPALCPFFHVSPESTVRCCLPIVMGGHVGAIMTFVIAAKDFSAKRLILPIVQKYLTECAPVLTSLNLLEITRAQSLHDPLTGIHNRRFLNDSMHQYEEIAKRAGTRVGFLMVDVDFFKEVNDQYGHLAGDAVLKDLAKILTHGIRAADLVVRFGGEEFLIMLHEVQQDFSQVVAEKIRRSVEAHAFILPDGTAIKKTISVGFAEYPDDADSFYKAIKFADVALYKAKEGGRNRSVGFTADMWNNEEY